ncbi:IclR family transcriptional regulator [Arthrobacter methylotrophus]|uniref:IclR family transcriptional regulator n=1 Tax=Arthrobacter methylotrophus TaxID=121291 RepID=A0ABV5UJM6_9MICC
MDSQTSTSGYRDRNSTADRALTILEMFGEAKFSVSAVEVAAALSVARSTAYRYLESLVSRGFLEESPAGGFRLGLRILELARVARQGYGLSEVALPRMRSLCDRFGQTVLLTRRAGTSVVCLEREAPSGQLLRISYERGSQLPLTAGASALVLLAWLEDAQALALFEAIERPRFTERTLSTPEDLLARLHEIRADGFAMTHAEVDPDALGIAAPIFAPDGEVAAGLSVVALGSRVNTEERQEIVAAVREAAEHISHTLRIAAG